MATSNEMERREYFRIHDRLPIEFRHIDDTELKDLGEFIRHNPTQVTDKLSEIFFLKERTMHKEKDQVSIYMSIINKKLDIILDYLYESRKSDVYHNRLLDVVISGAGMQFESDVVMREKDNIELKVILPVFPYPKITALCQVIRSEQYEKNGSTMFMVSMKFVSINESDRDLLISYVFFRERENLRSQKESAG